MAKMGKVSFSYSTCKFWYHPHSIVVWHAAQQSVLDAGDSAAPTASIFLASGFRCSQTESAPTHTQVTQTVGLPKVVTHEVE